MTGVLDRPRRANEETAPVRRRRLRPLLAHPVTHATVLIGVLGSLFLNAKSLWLDESISAGLGRGTWSAWYVGVAEDGGSQSLYFLLVRVFAFLGDEPWAIRFPAVLCAMAVPYPLWRLVEPRFGRFIATRALLITAVSASFIAMAQEARAYTALTAVITWCWFTLDQALQSGERRYWLITGALAALSLYAQPLGVPILIAMALWVVLNHRSVVWRHLVEGGALAALLVAPFAYLTLFKAVDHTSWLGTFTVARFVELVGGAFGMQQAKDAVVLSAVGTALAGLLALVAVLPRIGRSPGRPETRLFLLWLAVPVLVLLAGSVVRAYFSTRYAVPFLPAAATLAAVGLERVRELGNRGVARAVFAVLLISLFTRTMLAYKHEEIPWDELQPFIAAQVTPADMVAFDPPYLQAPFEYYTWLNGDGDTMARPMPPGEGWTVPRHPNPSVYPPDVTVAAPAGDLWIIVRAEVGLGTVPSILARLDSEMVEVERLHFGDGVVLRFQHPD